jgi:crotonobetainyl-CoA:carnitine CoA-transferase CaiB-like acyl-CoA transferase
MADDIEFVNGLIVKAPREGAPDFVKAAVSIKVADMMAWLQSRYAAGDEWVNIDVKEARSGKWYAAVNTYKPKDATPKKQKVEKSSIADMDSDVPF